MNPYEKAFWKSSIVLHVHDGFERDARKHLCYYVFELFVVRQFVEHTLHLVGSEGADVVKFFGNIHGSAFRICLL